MVQNGNCDKIPYSNRQREYLNKNEFDTKKSNIFFKK